MTHTPTPWTAAHTSDGMRTLIQFAGTPEHTATLVASVRPEDDNGEALRVAEANAAFIVRACNRDHLFDELVAALTECEEFIVEQFGEEPGIADLIAGKARAALARVQP